MKTIRNTPAKKIILDLILKSDVALSHSEIQHFTAGVCDRVTIYRILERLINEDLIHKSVNIDGLIKYAACNHASDNHYHQHVHFSCQICNLVTCLNNIEPKLVIF